MCGHSPQLLPGQCHPGSGTAEAVGECAARWGVIYTEDTVTAFTLEFPDNVGEDGRELQLKVFLFPFQINYYKICASHTHFRPGVPDSLVYLYTKVSKTVGEGVILDAEASLWHSLSPTSLTFYRTSLSHVTAGTTLGWAAMPWLCSPSSQRTSIAPGRHAQPLCSLQTRRQRRLTRHTPCNINQELQGTLSKHRL